MKRLLISSFVFLAITSPVFAHPGRTASDGCHYCRTNCDTWGVPWNERHCHGGGGSDSTEPVKQYQPAPNQYIPPTSAPVPTRVPTAIPTNTPIPTDTPTPSAAPTPTTEPTQEVLGTTDDSTSESDESKSEVNTEPPTAAETTVGLGVLGGMGYGVLWVGKKLFARFHG